MRSAFFGILALCAVGCTNETTPSGGQTPAPPATSKPVDEKPASLPTWPEDNGCSAASAPAGSIYAISAKRLIENDEFPLCRFEGNVLLVVNGASHCGYTPHYGPLQKELYAKYRAQGFYVLAFPSDTFNQEEATAAGVSKACIDEYGIRFPMFAIGNVNPPNEQPVYTWLKGQPGMSAAIPWNFEKFLISKTGQVVKRFAHTTDPDPATDPQIRDAIVAELAK